MLATGLLGSVVVLGLRARIIHADGLAGAGWFDAAWAISMRHVTLVLSSLQTYYLPVLASAHDREERGRQIARVLMVSTAIMVPLIVALEMANPWVLTLLYSDSFRPAAGVLRWTLVGDYLKMTSWVLAMPMLAVADMKIFLASEVTAQAVFVGGAVVLGGMLRPAQGTAIAYVASYAVYLAICYGYSRQRHGFRPSRAFLGAWWTGMLVIVGTALLRSSLR